MTETVLDKVLTKFALYLIGCLINIALYKIGVISDAMTLALSITYAILFARSLMVTAYRYIDERNY